MNYIRLNDGNLMPQIGMGVYLIDEGDSCVDILKTGIKLGYRMIDTAASYLNERSVGKAVRECGISREELFVSTKLWVQDYGYENARKAIDKCLSRLDIGYIDLLMIHRPAGDNIGAYKALEEAQSGGKVKSIGVSNHTASQLEDLLRNTKVVPAVDQVECHPLQQENVSGSIWMRKRSVWNHGSLWDMVPSVFVLMTHLGGSLVNMEKVSIRSYYAGIFKRDLQ